MVFVMPASAIWTNFNRSFILSIVGVDFLLVLNSMKIEMLTNCPLRFEISTESVFIFLRGDPFHRACMKKL